MWSYEGDSVINRVYYKCTVYYEFGSCIRDVITNCNMSLVLLGNECTISVQCITGLILVQEMLLLLMVICLLYCYQLKYYSCYRNI